MIYARNYWLNWISETLSMDKVSFCSIIQGKKLKPVLASKKPFAKDSANPSKLVCVVNSCEVHTRFVVVYFDGNFQLSD